MEDIHGQLTGEDVILPPEIMRDIISRLPVKPLCRFKLVSKPWRSLISNPDFIAKYNKDVFFQRRRLLFAFGNSLYSLDVGKFLSENRTNVEVADLVAAPTKVDYLPDGGRGWIPFVHYSSHGLFLSQSTSGGFSLVDPVTKESKKLPKAPTWECWPMKPLFWHLSEVGFDHSTNQYKVINGQHYIGDGIVFSVYTLQTDSWRKINYLYRYSPSCYDGIVVNGAVHWVVSRLAGRKWVIISFDLADEKVREIVLPPDVNACYPMKLEAFRNSLSITGCECSSSVSEDVSCSFWVMKEYGVRTSWTKMQVLKPFQEYLSHSGFWTESHDLMVFDKKSLVMYNFSDVTFWNISIGNISKPGLFNSVGIYVESLSSLSAQEQRKRKRGIEDEATQ